METPILIILVLSWLITAITLRFKCRQNQVYNIIIDNKRAKLKQKKSVSKVQHNKGTYNQKKEGETIKLNLNQS